MLLLVVEPELDDRSEQLVVGARLEQLEDRIVDAGTIIMNLSNRRAAQDAALRTRVHLADRVVVRVEQTLITVVDWAIARGVRHQDEVFKEPRRVAEVPLRRARFQARLYDLILCGQWRRQVDGRRADRAKARGQS